MRSIAELDKEILMMSHNISRDSGADDIANFLKLVTIVKMMEFSSVFLESADTNNDLTISENDSVLLDHVNQSNFSLELHQEIITKLDEIGEIDSSLAMFRLRQLDALSIFINIRNNLVKFSSTETEIDKPLDVGSNGSRRTETMWFLQTKLDSMSSTSDNNISSSRTSLRQHVSFSVFIFSLSARLENEENKCHSYVNDLDVSYLLYSANKEFDCVHRSTNKTFAMSSLHQDILSIDMDQGTLNEDLACRIVSLIAGPLFSDDIFALSSYQQALRFLSASSVYSFFCILQLYVTEMNRQPHQELLLLMNRSSAISIFQR